MTYHQRCLIVPAALAPLARELCNRLAPGAADGMFTTGLFTEGSAAPSFFISEGMIEDTFAALLPLTSFGIGGLPYASTGMPETVVLLAKGMVTRDQVVSLFSAIDVTEQSPIEAFARLGLSLTPIST